MVMTAEKRWIRKIVQNADKESANKLIEKYYREIYVFVFKQMLDEHLSLDFTQEIFIRMLQSIKHYDPSKSSFRTWLYRIATNHCIDYFRSKEFKIRQRIDFVDTVDEEGSDEVELTLEFKEDYEVVQNLLAKKPELVQKIIRYKIFLDYTFGKLPKWNVFQNQL
ncbi:RNA polymerase sigma factor [Bacillus andreraoultii]|uniref:RNA polymerase sigma factor n=1 Tax=Bacillus andreraoultii TaxID=1499685 RepID=UPI00067EF5A3|nr:RNA polymerase sigma factor [Bacillus andreraoultii]